jgi:hypothetical protein
MNLDDFLKAQIDDYIRYDIKFLSTNDAGGGGPTYPLAMICSSAIELLGSLMVASSNGGFNRKDNKLYFREYWENVLYKNTNSKKYLDAGKFYDLIRNGLAHNSIPKGNIRFLRHSPQLHLREHSDAGQKVLNIDVIQLGIDLLDSYDNQFKKYLLDGTNKSNAQTVLDEIVHDYNQIASNNGLAFPHASSSPQEATGPVVSFGSSVPTVNLETLANLSQVQGAPLQLGPTGPTGPFANGPSTSATP